MKHTILIVEDDGDINNLLAEILTRAGYDVQQAYSGTEGMLQFERQRPSLMLADLMLPGMTGEQLIERIRKESGIPVIVLSAKDSGQDKVHALKLGADDYVTKPFDEDELLARIEANLRRAGSTQETSAKLVYRDITMDRDTRRVEAGGSLLTLTAREYAILELMLSNPTKVFTKANIYSSVWQDEYYGDDNTVNVHISNLRAKLGGEYIQTVWGIGYKLVE